MVEPQARQVHGMPNMPIVPLMQGDIEGEEFVVSAHQSAGQIFVQFQGWVVAYDMGDIIGEAYDEIWGTSPDFNVGEEADLDDILDGGP